MGSARSWRAAVDGLLADLRTVFDGRLRSLVMYEAHGVLGGAPENEPGGVRHDNHVHTLAVADEVGYHDLERLASLAPTWLKGGLSVPLVLTPGELARSLDAFPLEFGQMIARHEVVAGDDPFAGLAVADQDLRRACETQARSHLLHLREGFIQAAGDPEALAGLVAASAVPLRALLVNIARLHGADARSSEALLGFAAERLGLPPASLRPLLAESGPDRLRAPDTGAFFPGYLQAVERLVALVDGWSR